LLILGPDLAGIKILKEQLSDRFRVKDLGPVAWYLGMQIVRDRVKNTIWITQSTYIKRAIEQLGMANCNPSKTPMDLGCQQKKDSFLQKGEWVEYQATKEEQQGYQSLVGTLLWIACQTRPDIAFAVGKCSRYTANPSPDHDKALKRIFRYLAETPDLGLRYGPTEGASGDLAELPDTGLHG